MTVSMQLSYHIATVLFGCIEMLYLFGFKYDILLGRQESLANTTLKSMQYMLPFVKQTKYDIPKACRLHPDNDMFREQELKKEHISTNQWQCSYCKKMFRSEKYLDQHLDNRHRALLNYVSTLNHADAKHAFVLCSRKQNLFPFLPTWTIVMFEQWENLSLKIKSWVDV